MKQVSIGGIFSLTLCQGEAVTRDADLDCFQIYREGVAEMIRIYIFDGLQGDFKDFCHQFLIEHVEHVIGPPYQTSIDSVEGTSWSGHQAVTHLAEDKFLINRVIANDPRGYVLRLEFETSGRKQLEWFIEVVEGIEFITSPLFKQDSQELPTL
jgi:hypothetical protein